MPLRIQALKLTVRKTGHLLSLTAVLALLLATGTPKLFAQNNRVSGLVTDPSGAVIPAALVAATNTATNVASNTQSNDRGYYELSLPVGSYSIEISKTGFSSAVQRNVIVTVGADIGLDISLQLATSTTRVTVESTAAPLISPNSSSTQTTVEPNLVQSLPLAVSGGIRNAADFLTGRV